jgi:rare lipoprotein A
VVSSCVEQRSPKPIERPSTPVEPVPPEATSPAASIVQAGYATFYARRFSGRRTANGERYDPSQLTAAHRTIPFGTLIDVRRADGDGRHVVVRINDRGPYVSNRIIDLSRRAAGARHRATARPGWSCGCSRIFPFERSARAMLRMPRMQVMGGSPPPAPRRAGKVAICARRTMQSTTAAPRSGNLIGDGRARSRSPSRATWSPKGRCFRRVVLFLDRAK